MHTQAHVITRTHTQAHVITCTHTHSHTHTHMHKHRRDPFSRVQLLLIIKEGLLVLPLLHSKWGVQLPCTCW